jgi:hypothetical protein
VVRRMTRWRTTLLSIVLHAFLDSPHAVVASSDNSHAGRRPVDRPGRSLNDSFRGQFRRKIRAWLGKT